MAQPRKFFVTLEHDEDGWFVAKCPSLPGCVSQGKTREEAIANIREAIEGSLKRLQTYHIEIIWVHDVAQDFYGDQWLEVFETARKGAFRALDRLRDEGVIKAWGLGVNRVEPIELLLELDEPRPDGSLLAGSYSLLDHDRALQRAMPMVGFLRSTITR